MNLTQLKWPNGPENLNRETGEVIMRAGSQSQRFDLGGFHSMTPLGGWPDPTPGLKYDHAVLSYTLEIPDGFEWVKGGKLPGLGGNIAPNFPGHSPATPPAGLNWTVRPMWAEGGRLWLYVWDMRVPAGGYPIQLFSKYPVLSPGNAYQIEVEAKMNRPGLKDGYTAIRVNGKTAISKRWAQFRNTDALGIDSVLVSVFYGGSGPEYAPKHDQTLRLSDIAVREV